MKDLVSVVLPVYNAGSFISDALESVLSQDYDVLEVIVVDDGSTDNTAEVISKFGGVEYLYQPNKGAGAARNMAIRASKGDYIAFIDADDLWERSKTRLQVEYLASSGLAWCYTDVYYLTYPDNRKQGKASDHYEMRNGNVWLPFILGKFPIHTPATMIRRDVFDIVGYYDETLTTAEHIDLWSRVALKYPVGYLNMPLTYVRTRPDSLAGLTNPRVAGNNRRKMINNLVAFDPVTILPWRDKLLAHSYIREGKELIRWGEVHSARKCFAEALRLDSYAFDAVLLYWGSLVEFVPKYFCYLRYLLLHKRRGRMYQGWWSKKDV